MGANDGGVVKFERWVARHGWVYWIALVVILSMLGSVRSVGPLLFLGGIGAGVWFQLKARGRHLPASDSRPDATPWVVPPSSRVSDARQEPAPWEEAPRLLIGRRKPPMGRDGPGRLGGNAPVFRLSVRATTEAGGNGVDTGKWCSRGSPAIRMTRTRSLC